MEQQRFKPSEAAKILGINSWTLRRWIREGRAPALRSESGRWYVPKDWLDAQLGRVSHPGSPRRVRPATAGLRPVADEFAEANMTAETIRCALYARQSSSENKAALQSQQDGLRKYAQAKGYQIVHVVTEIGSAINDERPKLHHLLKLRDFDILLVEHKDRLTRFGFRWFETLCPFKIEVVNLVENCVNDPPRRINDLMEDLVAIITSFCARLYGRRRGRKKTEAAVKALEQA